VTTIDEIGCLNFSVLIDPINECPLKAVKRQQEKCYSSMFPDQFYQDSIDGICQYVSVFFYIVFRIVYFISIVIMTFECSCPI